MIFLKYFNKNKLFFIFSLSLSVSYSQKSISGIVVDENNSPIEFANVFIQRTVIKGKVFGATTDVNGVFNILLDKKNNQNKYTITISFIGYETLSKTIIVDEAIHLNKIILKEKSATLDEIVISSKVPTITKEKDKLIFNIQNSPLKSGYDGIELLQNAPTVMVDENENILIRNETATILINGRKVNLSGESLTTYLSNLNSDNIKSIEIQTNKGGNLDATSTGGIINIILKKKSLGIKSQINLRYNYKGESYYYLSPNLNINYGTKNWNMYASYNFLFSSNNVAIANNVFFYNLEKQNKSIRNKKTKTNRNSFKIGIVREFNKKHNLGFEVFGRFNNSDLTDNGNSFYYEENTLNDTGLNNTLGYSNQNSINGVLNYSWKISKNDKLNTFIDYSFSNSKNNSTVITTYEKDTYTDNINTYNADSKTNIYALQIDYSKALKNKSTLDFGAKFTYSNRNNNLIPRFLDVSDFVIDTEQLSNFNYQENIIASYVSFDKEFNKNNYLKMGIRIENTALNKTNKVNNSNILQNYTSVFPSMYFSKKIAPKKTLAVGYSRSLSRPSFRDLNNNITKINDFQFVLGNPDLEPEFIDKYEITYQQNKNNFALYYKKTNDAINGIYFLEDDIAYYKKFNAGSQVQFGAGYNSSKKINNWCYLNISSNLYNRKYVDEQNISLFEKTTLAFRIYTNFKVNSTTNFDFSTNYSSPKSDAFYELSEYYNMNIGFKKMFFNKKISFRIDLKDIFNTLNYKNRREFNSYATVTNTKPITRFLSFRLSYNFSNHNKILGKKNKSKNDSYNRL